jgi:2,3-bisphosphoglycerate-dependent phosphoglycerate mutase
MMRSPSFLVFAFLVLTITAWSQEKPSLTTLVFVRHAEKVDDGTRDPELSEEGKQRVIKLSKLLSNQKIDAVYSTNYKRTRNTVEPIAVEHGLSVTPYESFNSSQLTELVNRYKSGTILICGHSNTTPAMINAILGKQAFKQWADADYGNFIIVTVAATGETGLTSLRY